MDNLAKALIPEFGEDVIKIQSSGVHPLLPRLTPIEVGVVWSAFSRHLCAGWMNVNEETLKQFQEWIVD